MSLITSFINLLALGSLKISCLKSLSLNFMLFVSCMVFSANLKLVAMLNVVFVTLYANICVEKIPGITRSLFYQNVNCNNLICAV